MIGFASLYYYLCVGVALLRGFTSPQSGACLTWFLMHFGVGLLALSLTTRKKNIDVCYFDALLFAPTSRRIRNLRIMQDE